jgi:hypothetical protein
MLVLAGCAAAPGGWHASPLAVQRVYQGGVPHTDQRGRLRFAYDPATSFLPIGLYHALTGRHLGRSYDLAAVRAAGFDTVYPWEGQDRESVTTAAKANGLAVIFADPTDAQVARAAHDPDSPVLAWTVDQEPTKSANEPEWRARLDRFRARRDAIHRLDPGRPVLVIDAPHFTGPTAERWAAWGTSGDVASHFNYPVGLAPPVSLSTTRGIPQSVARAAKLNGERKPVWLVVQAFASPHQGWAMPTPAQLRAMVYAGFIHGATGVIYFALDSFVTRDDGVIGIAPDPGPDDGPARDFNRDGRPRLVADAAQLAESRALWGAARRVNAELAALRPDLLTPTSRRPYRVEIFGQGESRAPIRTMLKERNGAAALVVVNVDGVAMRYRVSFDAPIATPRAAFEVGASPEAAATGWQDALPPIGVRVYRFRFAAP